MIRTKCLECRESSTGRCQWHRPAACDDYRPDRGGECLHCVESQAAHERAKREHFFLPKADVR